MKRMVRNTGKYLRILKVFLSLSNQKVTEYRASFYMTTFTIGLWLVSYFVWLLIIYKYTDSFAGYSIWQYIGFLGFYFFAKNLYWFFFETSLRTLSNKIYEGNVDMMIVKPVDSQFLASFHEFNIPSLFNSFFGLMTFVFSIVKLQMSVSWGQIFLLILIVYLSMIAVYSIMFSVLTLTFWLGRLNALSAFINMVFDDPATIPATAYQGGVKFLFYFVIPIALITTVPTSIFYFDINNSLILYYTIFTIIVFLLSRWIWKKRDQELFVGE